MADNSYKIKIFIIIFQCLKTVDDGFIEVQQNILNSRYNSLTIYYSELYGLCDENTDAYDDNLF